MVLFFYQCYTDSDHDPVWRNLDVLNVVNNAEHSNYHLDDYLVENIVTLCGDISMKMTATHILYFWNLAMNRDTGVREREC